MHKMIKRFSLQIMFLALLFGVGGCQFFYDEREESLLLVSAEQWSDLYQYQKQQRAKDIEAARPKPHPGSEKIAFSNMSDAYLSGCRTLGIIEVHHNGPYDEAMILAKNKAVELNASLIVPLDAYQNQSTDPAAGPQISFIKGRMLRCPASLSKESA